MDNYINISSLNFYRPDALADAQSTVSALNNDKDIISIDTDAANCSYSYTKSVIYLLSKLVSVS